MLPMSENLLGIQNQYMQIQNSLINLRANNFSSEFQTIATAKVIGF